MPSTAHQLRQPPTIEAVDRGQHFADVALLILINIMSSESCLKISYFSINILLSLICVPSLDYMTINISNISAPISGKKNWARCCKRKLGSTKPA